MADIQVDFPHGGEAYRLQAVCRSDTVRPDSVRTALEIYEEFWKKYIDLRFDGIGQQEDGFVLYTVFFEPDLPGTARGGQTSSGIRSGSMAQLDSIDQGSNRANFRYTVAHELFHAATFGTGTPFSAMPSFAEGVADAAAYMLANTAEREAVGLPSLKVYLNNPGIPMFDRMTPGQPESSQSTPTLFWLYWATRVGGGGANFEEGAFSALKAMSTERFPSDLTFETSAEMNAASGDFLGNSQSQLLLDAGAPEERFGLVSPSLSFGGKGAVHAKQRDQDRIDPGGWRVRPGDQCVAVADLIGNGRDQWVVQSRDPMYLGVIGYDRTDGHWGDTVARTLAVVPEQERWGGWKLRDGDTVHATGFLVDSDRAHMVVISEAGDDPAHIGILGLRTVDGEATPETAVAARDGAPLGEGGWIFEATDRVVAAGRVWPGRETEQFLIQRADGGAMGVISVAGSRFSTLALIENDQQFGSGWRVKAGDTVVGISPLGPSGTNEQSRIVLQSVEGNVGIVGFDDSEQSVTHAVFGPGSEISAASPSDPAVTQAWQWDRGQSILGMGAFRPDSASNNAQSQLLLGDERDMAVVEFDDTDRIVTADHTAALGPARNSGVKNLSSLLAVGKFSLGRQDVAYGSEEPGSRLWAIRLNESPNRGFGRWRFTGPRVAANGGTYSSLLYQLELALNAGGVSARFVELWRDFTIANVGYHLESAPLKWSYPFELHAGGGRPTPTVSAPPIGQGGSQLLQRWAAAYWTLAPGTSRVIGQAGGAANSVFWSAIVSDASGNYRRYALAEGNECNLSVDLQADETATLVVSTTLADVVLSLGIR